MRVLITCARAPVSIEWIRIFKKIGAKIILVDSLKHPIASFYKDISYIKTPSPKFEFQKYKEVMKRLISEVDLVIPNCEDIFYLAKVRDELGDTSSFFMPETNLLYSLHNKYQFLKFINSYVKIPKTELISNKKDIIFSKNTILKPLFSRFGKEVIRDVTQESIKHIECSEKYPWVQQQKIIGKAICNYAIIENNRVVSHIAYEPKYLLNASASTYFEPYYDTRLDNFIETFAKETNYRGQVAFDFIDNGSDLYILECNPRATSGLHIISSNLEYKDGEFKTNEKEIKSNYRIGNTLFTLFGFKALKEHKVKELISDYKSAKDVLYDLPPFAQTISMAELFFLTLKHKKSLTQISTYDIEFNG